MAQVPDHAAGRQWEALVPQQIEALRMFRHKVWVAVLRVKL